MGGSYPEPKNVIGTFPVNPESYLAVYPEIIIPPDQREVWFKDRTGAAVGLNLAERHGWKIGDRIPIRSTIYRKADGGAWELTVYAIYDATEAASTRAPSSSLRVLQRVARLRQGTGRAGSSSRSPIPRAQPIAKAIDERFANSPFETKTVRKRPSRRLHRADRQHRRDRPRSSPPSVLLHAPRDGGDDGAGRPRAHARAGGAENPGLRRRARDAARAHGVADDRARRRPDRTGARLSLRERRRRRLRRYLDAFCCRRRACCGALRSPSGSACSRVLLPAAQALRLRIVDALRSV